MEHLQHKVSELNGNLSLVISALNEIDDNNFDQKISSIRTLVEQIEEKRIYLKNNFDSSILKMNCDVANRAVKQIFLQFDSIIESKKKEQESLSSELAKIVNKKKLINYQR